MAEPLKRIDSISALTGFPPAVRNVPPVWPIRPEPGKVSLLWNSNFNDIYHKFSPYTNYKSGIFNQVLKNKQPFVYTYIDEINNSKFSQIPETIKSLASQVNITQGTINDVVRVGKFLVSSWGVQFLTGQVLVQRLASFDETRVYNPLSPILATVQPMTLGLGDPPMRHTEGGILGIASSVISSTIGINIFGNTFQTPQSTAGAGALPTDNDGQGKGLIRGETATRAYNRLDNKWPLQSGGLLGGLISMAINAATSFFGTTPKQPKGTQVRADEGGYTRLATDTKDRFTYTNTEGGLAPSGQSWYPPAAVKVSKPSSTTSIVSTVLNISSTIANYITNPFSLIGDGFRALLGGSAGSGHFQLVTWIPVGLPGESWNRAAGVTFGRGFTGNINGKPIGYEVGRDGSRYGDSIGQPPNPGYMNSNLMVIFGVYYTVNPPSAGTRYTSRFQDPTSAKVKELNENLKRVIQNINNETRQYSMRAPTDSYIISSGENENASTIGYGKIIGIPSVSPPGRRKNTYGLGKSYFDGTSKVRPVDETLVPGRPTMRISTTFKSDGLNLLPVLGSDKKTNPNKDNYALSALYPDWDVWKPHHDDLIAFYFYDVVNGKYIPFRATVKGISEGNTAYWDELRFIGRADQLYSYNGFARTLTFTFNVVVGSVAELLPTWKKINYLAGAVKPSNYTQSSKFAEKYSRFIVPPMFMVTIGDLYKFQPMVITSLNVNIPDDASWETLNQENAADGWSYLNGIITNSTINRNYAQLPKEVEIAITANLLEKERAMVGSAHFGHAPHTDNHEQGVYNVSSIEPVDYLPEPTEFSKNMIEFNPYGNEEKK